MLGDILDAVGIADRYLSKREVKRVEVATQKVKIYANFHEALAHSSVTKKELRKAIRKGKLVDGYRYTFLPKK